jgi:hypothetical protein
LVASFKGDIMGLRKIKRDILRREAKAVYKEKTKNIPRSKRIPFSKFFKEYINSKKKQDTLIPQPQEIDDFNFDDFINVNEISDEDLEDNNEEDFE